MVSRPLTVNYNELNRTGVNVNSKYVHNLLRYSLLWAFGLGFLVCSVCCHSCFGITGTQAVCWLPSTPKCHTSWYSPSNGPGIRLRWLPSSYQGYARLHTPSTSGSSVSVSVTVLCTTLNFACCLRLALGLPEFDDMHMACLTLIYVASRPGWTVGTSPVSI